MAKITINEISQNYSYAIGASSYAEVALPITACWGPGFVNYQDSDYDSDSAVLEDVEWSRFRSNNEGIEKFLASYRGKPTFADRALDKSFESALTLLSSGYDVLVCRLSCGLRAAASAGIKLTASAEDVSTLSIKAKYKGSFGNNIQVKLTPIIQKVSNVDTITGINVVVYVANDGSKTAVENFNLSAENDYSEYVSQYVDFVHSSSAYTGSDIVVPGGTAKTIVLENGDDGEAYATASSGYTGKQSLSDILTARGFASTTPYYTAATAFATSNAATAYIREWTFLKAASLLDQLTDKLSYSPDVIMHVWDDQDYKFYGAATVPEVGVEFVASPLDKKVSEIACKSRCGAGFISAPRSLARSKVKDYAALLSNAALDYTMDGLGATHSGTYGPWGRFRYQGTSLMAPAAANFLTLMMMRSMSLNSNTQYFWALPTNRKVSVELGEFDYKLSQAHLDSWQASSGVDVNALVKLPDLGTCLWGNSTLFNVPEATYNALQNMSTRLVFNELRDWSYRCGLSITFQYNNAQAYSAFYAGMVPILDSMRNVGAIDGYKIEVNAELDELGQVMANSVLGKIYLVVNGVVNDLTVDLIAMPAGTVLA